MAQNFCILLCIFIILVSGAKLYVNAANFTLVNQCKEIIWPGITAHNNYSAQGFTLQPGQTTSYNAPDGWSGRLWARTGCSFGKNGGSDNSTCQTGDCGPSLNCTRLSSLPITLVEFSVGNNGSVDFYDVSLVDGFNVPVAVQPVDGKGNCSTVGCDGDLRDSCPSELAVKSNGKVTACRSACDVFNTDEYCCRGAFSDPAACLATNYSRSFKQACPAASSYGGDTLTVTCSASEYIVAFCALRNKITCTYHDHKVVCTNTSASKGFKAIPGSWWSLMLALPFTSLLHTFLL
ncbi:hypothetical protein SLEP1_g33875 [Rubroshorea leprosula]|uniref:Thaumatin-like protein n=1 Tax=Rubroshorea leprosula TaxID=152421 RepID=A0AAV5KHZ8_9ROSI|nr:hypothetical protein SLEP1_g33875 [Rubroshorea leprosula]